MASDCGIDIFRLRTWALSYSPEGARSPDHVKYIDELSRLGDHAAAPVTISRGSIVVLGMPCVRLQFNLPQEFHCKGVTFIPVLVPNAFVGTGIFGAKDVFSSLMEEIIGWLSGSGPKHSLVRINRRREQQVPRPDRKQPPNGYAPCINALRQEYDQQDVYRFPDVGRIMGVFGVMQVKEATDPHDGSAGFMVTLILDAQNQMKLFIPRSIAKLPFAFVLDWIEMQDWFSCRADVWSAL